MRILFLQTKSNYPAVEPSLMHFGQGLPYIAASAAAAGHDVSGATVNYEWCVPSASEALENCLKAAVGRYAPDVIAMGGLTSDYLFVRDAIAHARKWAPGTPIVCGGGLITFDAPFVFSDLAPDYALMGDAEESFVMLLDCLEGKGNLETVPNLLYWDSGKMRMTEKRQLSRDLDRLPYPLYDIFDYNRYLEMATQSPAVTDTFLHTRTHPRVLPISLGRSCPHRCTFCLDAAGWGRQEYRMRSIESFLAEVVHFYNRYRFNFLFVYDELLAARKGRLHALCEGLKRVRKEHGMDFDWTCSLRVDSGVNEDLLREMKEAGCAYIMYGLESASPEVLASMKKGITPMEIMSALEATEKAGLGFQGNLILGDVAETVTSVRQTRRAYETRFKDHMVSIGFVVPYPGSSLFLSCVDRGLISDRKGYYEVMGRDKAAVFNMTSMPTPVFKDVMGEALTKMSDFLAVRAASAERKGTYPADRAAPEDRKRENVRIVAFCPHCGLESEYLYPLDIGAEAGTYDVLAYCVHCHKRYAIQLSV
jgi:anaerobic magnesium-protoporphyrin IX monomethyl ester cyclase